MDQINIDLTYAVCFNLAHAYHGARMHDEALHTYSLLVKNKQYPQSGRLRVNMGNIYFEQHALDRRAARDHERPQIEHRSGHQDVPHGASI